MNSKKKLLLSLIIAVVLLSSVVVTNVYAWFNITENSAEGVYENGYVLVAGNLSFTLVKETENGSGLYKGMDFNCDGILFQDNNKQDIFSEVSGIDIDNFCPGEILTYKIIISNSTSTIDGNLTLNISFSESSEPLRDVLCIDYVNMDSTIETHYLGIDDDVSFAGMYVPAPQIYGIADNIDIVFRVRYLTNDELPLIFDTAELADFDWNDYSGNTLLIDSITAVLNQIIE